MCLQMYLNHVLMDDDELQGYSSLSGIDYTNVMTLHSTDYRKVSFAAKFCNYFCTINYCCCSLIVKTFLPPKH